MKLNRSGFTLIEMVLTTAVLGVVMTLAFSMLGAGNRFSAKSGDEYRLQASVRMASHQTSEIVKFSSAVFTITKDNFREGNLSDDWNYFGVSADKTEIIQYTYNPVTDTHLKKVIVASQPNLFYDMQFIKENTYDVDKLLRVKIVGYLGAPGNETIAIDTELKSLNALQIIDRGNINDIATAVAYRSDDRPLAASAAVAMVMDNSGSMASNMNGNNTTIEANKRITILKTEAKNFVNRFAQLQNVDIALVPFATSANNPMDFVNVYQNQSTLIAQIDSMTAFGGTNTGDGLRRGLHRISEYNDGLTAGSVAKNYMIVLVDGVTTYGSVVSNANRSYFTGFDADINEGRLDLPHHSDYDPVHGQISGNGSSLDAVGTGYVNAIGTSIRNYPGGTPRGIKVYVIAFSANSADQGSLTDISTACGAVKQFLATNQTELQSVFDEIGRDVENSLWQASGPQ